MELYDQTAQKISRRVMREYSTSFGTSSLFFPRTVRCHIYNIYGLVRIADEIVDTYRGNDAKKILDDLERETMDALSRGYSANPIVHAYALTYRQFSIDTQYTTAFFASMRLDVLPHTYTDDLYETYIYGSAEVIGLMCLTVFCDDDKQLFERLRPGASRLGAAYQKVNFLRDLAADSKELSRLYFPGYTIQSFNEVAKQKIVDDIKRDFAASESSIDQLPKSAKRATRLSRLYYGALLHRLEFTPVAEIKHVRVRISNWHKAWLWVQTFIGIYRP